jgi:hypothetical protein
MRKCEDFNDPSCDEIFVGWYSPPIYDVYFDNIYIDDDTTSNDSNSNYILINKMEVEWKQNTKSNQQKKIVNLSYVDIFDYKFIIIIKIDMFKRSHVNEKYLRFVIHYFESRLKRNHLSIDVSYVKLT